MDSEESGSENGRESKKRKRIVIEDEDYTARMATCESCKKGFDVIMNHRGHCVWHSGIGSPMLWNTAGF
jgi:hypothetical protein